MALTQAHNACLSLLAGADPAAARPGRSTRAQYPGGAVSRSRLQRGGTLKQARRCRRPTASLADRYCSLNPPTPPPAERCGAGWLLGARQQRTWSATTTAPARDMPRSEQQHPRRWRPAPGSIRQLLLDRMAFQMGRPWVMLSCHPGAYSSTRSIVQGPWRRVGGPTLLGFCLHLSERTASRPLPATMMIGGCATLRPDLVMSCRRTRSRVGGVGRQGSCAVALTCPRSWTR